MFIIFACRRYRQRDITLLRLGIAEAGHRLWVAQLPFAMPLICLVAMLRLLGVRMHLVISDKMVGDTFLAWLFGRRSTRMLWNYVDEWPADTTRLPRRRVCFFPEKTLAASVFVFAPQPVSVMPKVSSVQRSILFIGDVTLDASLPMGTAWWLERFEKLRDIRGYAFYLHPDYDKLIDGTVATSMERRLVRVFAKNLLRLWIVQDARVAFGDRVTLVGSNWRRFSQEADPSSYTEASRLSYFCSARVNLDCASKSGDTALYPRSSELISFAGGLVQVCCADSAEIFGERVDEFCFHNRDSLIALLEQRLVETDAKRIERDQWLVRRLHQRRLLMQHSIERLLDQAKC